MKPSYCTVEEIVLSEKNRLFPNFTDDRIFGPYLMRFELGGDENVVPNLRVNQATMRGTDIYDMLIGNKEILIVLQESESSFWNKSQNANDYIFTIIDKDDLKRIKGPFYQTYYEEDENGNLRQKIFNELIDCDLLVGRIRLTSIQVENIVRGLASLEMGMDGSITQDVTFYLISDNIGIHIYDDRGCDVWSNSLDSLYPLYIKRNNWILDYNRNEIDMMFKNFK